MADAAGHRVGDRGVVLEQPALGGGQPVTRGRADRDPQQQLRQRLAQLPRHVGRDPRPDDLIRRLPEQALGDHPAAVARREQRPIGHVGEVGGDVHRAVAHPDHQHPPAAEVLGGAVLERVQLLPAEVARVGRIRPLGHVVVPVGHHEGVGALALAALQLQLPSAAVERTRVAHACARSDPLAQPEAVDVALEVAAHRVAAGVVRRARRHRQLGELGPRPAGDQVQGAIGGGRPVLEAPDAADPAAALVGHGVDPRGRQGAQGGQARGTGPDDRHPWSVWGRHSGGHSIRVARRGQPGAREAAAQAVPGRAGATLGAARRRGGVVTQRPAKPFTPVRFRSSPWAAAEGEGDAGCTLFRPLSCIGEKGV